MPINTDAITKAKTVITVDLTKQAYPVFNDANLELANKNFIFGKNGAGKSTLVQLIKDQMSESYDVYAFQGFSRLLGINENLDAFSLAVDAGDNENRIKELEKDLVQEQMKLEKAQRELTPLGDDTSNLLSKQIDLTTEHDKLKQDIHNHKVKLASSIKNKKDPQIAPPTYNIKRLEEEELNAALLQDSDVNQMTKILRSEILDSLDIVSFKAIDFSDILMKTNDVLHHSIKEKSTLARLDTEEKTEFAHTGWELHDSGEICAFCGNQIADDKYQELTNYFAADDVIKQEETVQSLKTQIQNDIDKLTSFVVAEATSFYSKFTDAVTAEIKQINSYKEKQLQFLHNLLSELNKNSMFVNSQEIDEELPLQFELDKYNELVKNHNEFGMDLDNEKSVAASKLRWHEIKKSFDAYGYDAKKAILTSLQSRLNEINQDVNNQKETVKNIQATIDTIQQDIENLKPKAEMQAVNNINKKLRLAVPWQLDFMENENQEFTGYYKVVQDGESRSVYQLSDGEKNIIAFLYFIEKLDEISEDRKKRTKIVIFDDPMTSNDDTMQYLIITELKKLYTNKFITKFNSNKDCFVMLTHNAHFYLNTPPEGAYKDDNGKTKYHKNNFYHIQNKKFEHVLSVKDDFATSYAALWKELKALHDGDLRNSMLNSMRRIVQTYTMFHKIKQDEFYQNSEQYLKQFNVNSHDAVGDIDAEAYTESAEQMKIIFKQLFEDNKVGEHFDAYWPD